MRTHIQIQGAKTLILDPGLAGPLGLITEVALLKVSCRAPISNGRWERYNAMAFTVTRHVFEQG